MPAGRDLLSISYDNWSIDIKVDVFAFILLMLSVLFCLMMFWLARRQFKSDVDLDIQLGGYGTLKIKPNYEVQQIAHKAWVELKTRKAGILIDKNNDVISDIYASWYQLFGEIRTLARDIPASKLKNRDTARLVDLLVDSLNNGLRPHLTVWRAKYQRWYENAVSDENNKELTPQDIQQKYPQYQELVDDMLDINQQLVQYANELKKLTH